MARFAISNSEDQRAAVWVVSILLLIYTTLTTMVRGVVKLKMMGLDDGVASLAQLLTYGNVASVVYALHHGLARREAHTADGHDVPDYGKALQASIVLYLLTLATAKVAMVLFLRRAFQRTSYTHAISLCYVAIAILSFWGIGAAIAVSVNCGSEYTWRISEDATCNGNTRWLVIALLDGLTEIGILVVAISLVSQLQMKLSKKITVLAAFVWRLGLVILAGYHYRSYRRTSSSSDTNFVASKLVIWEQASICYSLLSITWPFSRAFINGFDTAPLAATSIYGSGAATSHTGAKHGRRSNKAVGKSSHPWDNSGVHSSAVYSRPTASKGGSESFGSQEMIIRRDHEIDVTFHTAEASSKRTSNTTQ